MTPWLLWAVLGIVGGVGLGLVVVSQLGAGGRATDFPVVAYQGQETLGGDEVSFLQVLDRGKPVILNFWAALCPPCRQEMPGFQRVYDEFGDRIVMVGVDVGPFVGLGSNDEARRFLREYNISYPAAYATNSDPVRDYALFSMPTTVFLTPDGLVFERWVGYLPEDRLRSILQDLLASL